MARPEAQTAAQYRESLNKRPTKYRNVPTMVGKERFASKREALRHIVLKQMARNGEITQLRRQPRFKLEVCGKLICAYVGDWAYWQDGAEVVEDSKGVQTRDFKIKWKLCKALHPEIEWRLS